MTGIGFRRMLHALIGALALLLAPSVAFAAVDQYGHDLQYCDVLTAGSAWCASKATAQTAAQTAAQNRYDTMTQNERNQSFVCQQTADSGGNLGGANHPEDHYAQWLVVPNGNACNTGNSWYEYARYWHHAPLLCPTTAPPLGPQSSRTGNVVCKDGCQYQADVTNSPYINFGGPTFAKRWAATGNQCTNEAPPQPYDENQPVCHGVGNKGALECVYPDGKHCVRFASGLKQCWGPGETGERRSADGKEASDRKPAPGIPSPPSDMTDPVPHAPSPGTTTTINGNTYNTNSFSGTGGAGQGNNGTGGNDPNDPDKDGDNGKASGGDVCGSPPACTGNVIQCYMVKMQYLSRCGDENIAKTFGDELAGELEAIEDDDVPDSWLGEHQGADGNGDLGRFKQVKPFDASKLDESGFLGGGQCPQMPTPSVAGHAIPIEFGKICELLVNVSHLVMALAYFLAFRIIAGGGSK